MLLQTLRLETIVEVSATVTPMVTTLSQPKRLRNTLLCSPSSVKVNPRTVTGRL